MLISCKEVSSSMPMMYKKKVFNQNFVEKTLLLIRALVKAALMIMYLFVIFVDYLAIVIQIVKMMPVTFCSSNVKSATSFMMVVVLKSVRTLPRYQLKSKRNYVKIQKELYLEHFLILESNQGWILRIEPTNIVFIQEMPIRNESKNGTCLQPNIL